MELGRLGVWCITDALTPEQLTELAQRTERLGYGALWYVEAVSYEAFALASFLLNQTETLIVASGIANIYARDATSAKQGQHSLAKFSGGRFLLGLGVSHTPLVEDLRGHHYGRPVPTMRAYLDAMEKAATVAPLVGRAATNGAGRIRPQDDRTGRGAYRWSLALQRHPGAHSMGERGRWPGQMAMRRAEGPARKGPHEGTRGGASSNGAFHARNQLPK